VFLPDVQMQFELPRCGCQEHASRQPLTICRPVRRRCDVMDEGLCCVIGRRCFNPGRSPVMTSWQPAFWWHLRPVCRSRLG